MSLHTTPDSYTKLLIHSNTSDGSTTFADSSATGHTITVSGHTHHETDQYKFGSTSIQFDGTGDVLSVADHADWTYGTGDFTIDMWIRPTTIGSGGNKDFIGASSNQHIAFACNSTGGIVFYSGNGSWVSTVAATSNVIVNNVWQHIAVSRADGVVYLFYNGTLLTSRTQADSIDPPNVEVGGYGGGASDLFTGYMDEIRISKGIARWTDSFVPPNKPYSVVDDDFVTDVAGIEDVGDGITKLSSDIIIKSDPDEASTDIVFSVQDKVGTLLLEVRADGIVTKPYQPSFAIRGVNGTHTWTTSYDEVEFLTTDHDIGSNLSVSGGATRFTAPIDGVYLFCWNLNAGNNSDDTSTRYAYSILRKNGTMINYGSLQGMVELTDGYGSGNSYDAHSNSAIIKLNQNDYITVYFGFGSSGNYDGTIYGDATYFTGCLLG